jgi:hypothetical protein
VSDDFAYDFLIEAGKVAEFAKATKSSRREYQALSNSSIPPTFLFTAGTFWAPVDADPSGDGIGLDLTRILHAEEEFVFHGPPPAAGSHLKVTPRIGEPYEKQGSRGGRLKFVEIVNEFRDLDGRLVAEQKSLLVETERPPTAEASA